MTDPLPVQRRGNGTVLPGSVLNPTGRPAAIAEVQKLARQHTSGAIARLAELALSSDGKIALAAIEQVLDRAWGKPMQQTQADVRKLDLSAIWLAGMKEANGCDPAGVKLIEGTDETEADAGVADGSGEPQKVDDSTALSSEIDW